MASAFTQTNASAYGIECKLVDLLHAHSRLRLQEIEQMLRNEGYDVDIDIVRRSLGNLIAQGWVVARQIFEPESGLTFRFYCPKDGDAGFDCADEYARLSL